MLSESPEHISCCSLQALGFSKPHWLLLTSLLPTQPDSCMSQGRSSPWCLQVSQSLIVQNQSIFSQRFCALLESPDIGAAGPGWASLLSIISAGRKSALLLPLQHSLECSVHTLNLSSSCPSPHICLLSLDALMPWVEVIRLVLLRFPSFLANCLFNPVLFPS